MRRRTLILLLPLLISLPALAGGGPEPLIDVEFWRVKPGGNKPFDFWLEGTVKNVSAHRLTGVTLGFKVEDARGAVLGEAEAPAKLSIMLPGQESLFAAQVPQHDRRTYKLLLSRITVDMVDDMVLFKEIPFHAARKSGSVPQRRLR